MAGVEQIEASIGEDRPLALLAQTIPLHQQVLQRQNLPQRHIGGRRGDLRKGAGTADGDYSTAPGQDGVDYPLQSRGLPGGLPGGCGGGFFSGARPFEIICCWESAGLRLHHRQGSIPCWKSNTAAYRVHVGSREARLSDPSREAAPEGFLSPPANPQGRLPLPSRQTEAASPGVPADCGPGRFWGWESSASAPP